MAGSDRVPDPNDSKRAQVGNAQTDYESEMALFHECMWQCAQKELDTADIVRDGILQQISLKPKAGTHRASNFLENVQIHPLGAE